MQKNNCKICGSNDVFLKYSLQDYFFTKENFEILECNTCGFCITSGIENINELGKYYNTPKYLSHDKSKRDIISLVYNAVKTYSISRKFLLINKETKGKKILEIGCGTGDLLSLFNKKNWNTFGVEPNENARKYAQETLGLNIVDSLNQVNESDFDVIMLWHVLEHIEDLNNTIEAIKSKLSTNGKLIIALPNPQSYDAKYYKKYWAGWDVPRHLYHFKQENIKTLLDKFSIRIYKTVPLVFDSFFISLISEEHKGEKNTLKKVIKAFLIGLFSNIKAWNTSQFSSLIYIAKLK